MSETSEPTMPGPNKLCPILMIAPPKTGTYGDIVCLEDKCQMWRLATVYDPLRQVGICGLAGKP